MAKRMKFGDMSYGTHFEEVGGRRKFIKIQDVLPSGLKQTCMRIAYEEDGKPYGNPLRFNAIDYNGIPGRVPDWVEYDIIKEPHFGRNIH